MRGEGHLLGRGLVRCGCCGEGMTKGRAGGIYDNLRCNTRGGGHATIPYAGAVEWIVNQAFTTGVSVEAYAEGVTSLHSREALLLRIAEAEAEITRQEEIIGTTLPPSAPARQALEIALDALATLDAESGTPSVITRAEFERLELAEQIKALRQIVRRVVIEPGAIRDGKRVPVQNRIRIEFVNGTQHPAPVSAGAAPVVKRSRTAA